MDWKSEIEAAEARIRPYVHQTRILPSPGLGDQVFFKLENEQQTGSFKARGAMNKLLCVDPEKRKNGVIAASSGNHGAAVSYGAKALGTTATIYVPNYADPAKVAAIEALGGTVIHHGDDCVDTEGFARARCAETGQTYISPYNDAEVVAGQGTIAVELRAQIPDLSAVFVAVGGGGMIGGIGAYLKAINPNIQIVACSPANSPALHACLQAGMIKDVPCEHTLSDATAGGIEHGAITFELCRSVIDESLLLDESSIATGMRRIYEEHGMMVEGAAGLALAGYLQVAQYYAEKKVAIILCGANMGEKTRNEVFGT